MAIALPVDEFISAATGDIDGLINRLLKDKNEGKAQVNAWKGSLPALADVLRAADRSNLYVILEFVLKGSGARPDVIIVGSGEDNLPQLLVVEQKGWSTARIIENEPVYVEVDGVRYDTRHPAIEAIEYVEIMSDHLAFVEESGARITGCVFLHNARTEAVATLKEMQDDVFEGVFAGEETNDLVNLIRQRFPDNASPRQAQKFTLGLLDSRTAPSRQLMDNVGRMIGEGKLDGFVLSPDQRIAFDATLKAVLDGAPGVKQVFIVTGGPGSGKSLVAAHLLGALHARGKTTYFVTGSKAFLESLTKKIVSSGIRGVKGLFRYTHTFAWAPRNEVDAVIIDEAQRIRESSNHRFTPRAKKSTRTQIDELIESARVAVFLLDDYQIVKPNEVGSTEYIAAAAARLGVPSTKIDLIEAFRTGGSKEFVRWVEALLGIRGEPFFWQGDEGYEVSLAQSVVDLEAFVLGHASGETSARLAAGYCWKWSKPLNDGLVNDIVIGEWERPWDSKADRYIGSIPPAKFWGIDHAGVHQVGCVYTAQGFEYDYSGVIMGPDYVIRDGQWQVIRSGSKDPDLLRTKSMPDEILAARIPNIYRILLTRGLKALQLYSCDPETQAWLAQWVPGASANEEC